MLTALEVRPVTNPYVMNLFARGNILSEADQVEQVRSMLFNALAEFGQRSSDWRLALYSVNRILLKNCYKMRVFPAGIIPFFQHPVAVVFKLTGDYCIAFDLIGLDNGTRELDLPVEANMSNSVFMDLLTGIINKNRDIGNSGLVYNVLTRLIQISGLQSYGVTLRQNPEQPGHDLLVIAENPFGMELRLPLKPVQRKDIRLNVKCVIGLETKNKKKKIPDVFFILAVLQDISNAWPEDKSAAELVRLVENALTVLANRAITKRPWYVDKRISKNRMPIGCVIKETSWDSQEQPGSVRLPLISEKDDTIRFIVAFKGLSEAAAKSIENIYRKRLLSGSLKHIFTPRRKTDFTGGTEFLKPVTFRKASTALSRAILKSIQSHLSISYAELAYAIQREMKRGKLEKEYAVDLLRIKLEQNGPAVYVTEIASDQTYKFIIERRTDETTQNYGLIQVDKNDEEIRRFAISKNRLALN
jgi:hypothetical protein